LKVREQLETGTVIDQFRFLSVSQIFHIRTVSIFSVGLENHRH